jgi:hypothetical protein
MGLILCALGIDDYVVERMYYNLDGEVRYCIAFYLVDKLDHVLPNYHRAWD